MHELVDKALYWTGFRGKEYAIRTQQIGNEQQGNSISFSVYDGKRFKETIGPFSAFNMVSRIDRKRIIGRLEWTSGISSALGGSALVISSGQLLPGLGFVVLGILLTKDGKERRDLASSIINNFTRK